CVRGACGGPRAPPAEGGGGWVGRGGGWGGGGGGRGGPPEAGVRRGGDGGATGVRRVMSGPIGFAARMAVHTSPSLADRPSAGDALLPRHAPLPDARGRDASRTSLERYFVRGGSGGSNYLHRVFPLGMSEIRVRPYFSLTLG